MPEENPVTKVLKNLHKEPHKFLSMHRKNARRKPCDECA